MTRSTISALPGLVAVGGVLALVLGSAPSPAGENPDLDLVSVGASHTRAAPGSSVLLTVAVRATGAASGPFDVRAFYADGPARAGLPRDARELAVHPLTRGVQKNQLVTFGMPVHVPPCDDCGQGTVYVVLQPGNTALNMNLKNDVRTVSLDVSRAHLPDLRSVDVRLDRDRGSTSDSVRVFGVVRNDSAYFAEGPFRVSVYCSADSTLTEKDRRLHSFMVPSLAAGQVVGVDRAVQLVPECGVYAGSTWIGILADDQNALNDSNSENNGASRPYRVLKAPDLTNGELALSATSGPVGSRVLVSYRVDNLGESAAGAFKTGVFIARPGEALERGTLLDGAAVASLAAGTRSGSMQHLVSIPALPRGRYALGVRVDVEGNNGELRRVNNALTQRFDVTEINLRDVHFTARTRQVTAMSAVELAFAVRNDGRDEAPPSKLAIYYSDDPRFDRGEDQRLAEVTIGKVRPGRSTAEATESVKVPAHAREGYRYLFAVIDDEDAVAETDERDNVALEPIYVVPSAIASQ